MSLAEVTKKTTKLKLIDAADSPSLCPHAQGEGSGDPVRVPPENLIWQPRVLAVAMLGDMLVITAAGLVSRLASTMASAGDLALTLLLALSVAGGTLWAAQKLWAYTIPALSGFSGQMVRVGAAFAAVVGAVVALAYAAGLADMLGRGFVLGWLGGGLALIGAGRFVLAAKLKAWTEAGRLARRAVIVGGGKAAGELLEQLERAGTKSVQILGLFDDRGHERSPDKLGKYEKLGTFDEMAEFCRVQRVDLLILTLPPSAEERMLHLLRKLWVLPIDIRISAHQSKLRLKSRAYSWIGGVPFLAVFDKPLNDWAAAAKAVEDRVLGLLLLIAFAPVMALVALAVKLDSKGPALFKQKRFGFNNELIEVYKFRSMYTDMCDAKAAKLVTKDDPRVTKVGKFIRKTSLDELPQLINVVKGELSLVGPRPHAVQAKAGTRVYDEVVDGYFARHRMKPGITGWAQVNGWRGETDTEEKIQRRVEHDVHYIDHWSIAFDLYILAMTPISLVTKREGAY